MPGNKGTVKPAGPRIEAERVDALEKRIAELEKAKGPAPPANIIVLTYPPGPGPIGWENFEAAMNMLGWEYTGPRTEQMNR